MTEDTAKDTQSPKNTEDESSVDYFRLVYLFYRHPKEAFKIINSGKAIHGIVFFAVFVFIIKYLYCIWGYYFSGIFYVFLDWISLFENLFKAMQTSLISVIENYALFGIGAVSLLFLLWVMRFRVPVKKGLNVIFYSAAIAFPFTLLVYVADIYSGHFFSHIFDYIAYMNLYLLPLAYLEYIGFKELLKTKSLLVPAGVIISVLIQYLAYVPFHTFLMGA